MKSDYDVPSLRYALRKRGYLARLWALIKPYWFSKDRWPARGLLLLVIALTLAGVYITVLLAEWNRLFFDALQAKNHDDFLHLLIRFCILAAVYILFAAYGLYFNQMLQIRWRRWLTEQYYRDWLADRSYYLLQLEKSDVENPEQRIQDDIGMVTTMTLDLGIGLLNSVVTLASFLLMLWNLSGTLTLHVAGLVVNVPGYMVWMAIIYSALGSIATHYVGRPLIGINFDLQRYDADFRFRMIRIRENAESVALYGGEEDEGEKLRASFANIWRAWWRLIEVLSYPDQPDGRDEETYRRTLADAGLPQLSDRLNEQGNWSLDLSGGEQQRIGFARAFLYRPDWLFMDEATSALDEPAEQALYAILRERLPEMTMISVAHRSGVARFHARRLTIQPETKSLIESLASDTAL